MATVFSSNRDLPFLHTGHGASLEELGSSLDHFSVAFFSDPPVASWVLSELLNSGLRVSSVVTLAPKTTRHSFPQDLKRLADGKGVPLFNPDTLHSAEFQQAFKKTKPSVIAAMSFLRKVPPEILQMAPLGGINWHPALLPRYRGSFPYFWIILNQDKETGVTIHEMTNEFDAGDIHYVQKIPVDSQETAGTLTLKCASVGIQLLLQTLRELAAGKSLPRAPQDPSLATYGLIPDASVLEINWDEKAMNILALIRAGSPFLGAMTIFRNLILRIWSARLSRPNDEGAKPGTLIVSRGRADVATQDYFITLETVQLELLRFYSGQEFLQIAGLVDGEILGRP